MEPNMNPLYAFAKDLKLSEDEKLLRKYSLKNANGDFTLDAKEIVLNKLVEDNVEYLLKLAKSKDESQKKLE